jgi:hypothetical protein
VAAALSSFEVDIKAMMARKNTIKTGKIVSYVK